MYLSANNRDNSTFILSIKEIIGIVLVFSFMLYLLFPKDDIDSILEGEGQNKNLSINYLESMLLYYPESIKLQMILIRNYRDGGKEVQALKLTHKLLKEVQDKAIRDELYRFEYLLLKDLYFTNQTPQKLKVLKEKLWHYFYRLKEPIDYTFFFAESSQIDIPELKFIALKKVMKKLPEIITYDFEKGFFQLASALKENKDAYASLQRLLTYPEVEEEIKLYAISFLYAYEDYEQALNIVNKLFTEAKNEEKIREYFELELGILMRNSKENPSQIKAFIQTYQRRIKLQHKDMETILKNLIAMGDNDSSAYFAKDFFHHYPQLLKEKTCKLSIDALVYNQQLEDALSISYFAKEKFPSSKWLDKTIQLALWNGKMEEVIQLNSEGYKKYNDPKYKNYLLNSTSFNTAYKILGEMAKKSLENGDFTMLKQMVDYFDYTGEIAKGEAYFTHLLKKQPHQNILKEAISFSYKNNHFQKGLTLYNKYQKAYGIDKTLQKKSIDALTALKRHKEAYLFSKALKEESKQLLDMAQIAKDYQYLYHLLWSMEKQNKLPIYNYGILITLEKELKHGKKIEYLYQKAWQHSQSYNYLYALLYTELEEKNFIEIEKTLHTIKDKKSLYEQAPYHIFMANFYAQTGKNSQALKHFQKALALNKKDVYTHQAYLWFLLNLQETKALKQEISLLRKQPTLQKHIGFASVIGALQLQKSDLALRWLRPMLKNSNNLEYQMVYADILDLQDRKDGANKIRMHLFRELKERIKKEPKLLKDKTFVKRYLQLAFRYKTPVERRINLLKKFKSLFNKQEYQELEIGYYTFTQSSEQVKYLSTKYKMDIPWLNFYLAMRQNDNQTKQTLLKEKGDTLAIRDRVKASLDIGDRSGAYTLAFQGLENNHNDGELYRLYNDIISQDYPKGLIQTNYKVLSENLSLKEQKFTYRWFLHDNTAINLSLNHDDYSSNHHDDILGITLEQQDQKLSWKTSLTQHFSKTNFMGVNIEAKYIFKESIAKIEANYQTKTTQTPTLQTQGMEDSLLLNINTMLTQRLQLGINYKASQYKLQDNYTSIGTANESQINLNYLLHAGYPDIHFNSYLSHHNYDIEQEGFLPQDFLEFGTQVSIGERGRKRLHHSWKPFGSLGFAINNHQDLGASLSIGTSSSIKGSDALSLMFNYSKGIDMISQPSYGIHIEYKF